MIVSAATLADKKVEFNELDLGSNEALEKAMLYGMTTVPSFVIRGKVFNTATPPLNEIVAAFQSNVV